MISHSELQSAKFNILPLSIAKNWPIYNIMV